MPAPTGRATSAATIRGTCRRIAPIAVSAILVIPACSSDGGSGDAGGTAATDAPQQTSVETTAAATETSATTVAATTATSAAASAEAIPGGSECGFEGGEGCSPQEDRVDTVMPAFSNPTQITNPYFPTTMLAQVVQIGEDGDSAARNEITLLPQTKVVEWNGLQVETVVSQFIGYVDGRIVERAVDYLAQADDGSVWYFGEDVENFDDGVLSDSGGSWLAGRDGPAGMIMPAAPAVGDVYRPENVPGLVFEEDTVTSVSEPIETPSGPAADGLAIEEHTQEGSSEIKIYAKGYGEFGISTEDEVLTVAIASPIDATGGPAPPELETIDSSAGDVLDAATEDDWEGANEALGELSGAWATVSPGVPAVLAAEVSATIDALVAAVAAEDASSAQQAAIDVALAGLDVQLRHRPAPDIDIERIEHWANRILVDAEDDEPLAAIRSDIAIIESIWARASGAVGGDVAAIVDGQLAELRVAADAGDVDAAIAGTEALLRTYDGLG